MGNAILAIAIIFASFLTAMAALVGFAMLQKKKESGLGTRAKVAQEKISFLFEDDVLVDSTMAARRIFSNSSIKGSDWEQLVSVLKVRFENIATIGVDVLESGFVSYVSGDKTSRLEASIAQGMLRLELSDVETSDDPVQFDRHSLLALQDELATYRATAAKVPFLNWHEDKNGGIVWANRAYLDIAEILDSSNSASAWPPTRIFAELATKDSHAGPLNTQRATLTIPGETRLNWFQVHRADLENGVLYSAIPIDQTVKAEETLSEFVTTLTGTFAHLPIGLAIFDFDRKLSLFNPALTDLTMLPAEFLCGQPTLFAFLDRLRDKRMMPEPKDYKTWRQEMSELEEKAANGTYCETWFLPTGQTYRVTGRPHPGGGLAMLLEDITSEISLSHRYQAELDMSRSVLDSLDHAVAVFSAGGVLSIANAAYTKLWGTDPSTSLNDISISEATMAWSHKTNPTPVWQELRSYLREQGRRKKWKAPVSLKDGRVLDCQFTPMVEGATLVSFTYSIQEHIERPLDQVPAMANV